MGMWTRGGERDSQEVGAGKEGQQVSQRLDSESRLWDNAHGSNVSWILPHPVSTLKLPLSGWLLFKQLERLFPTFILMGFVIGWCLVGGIMFYCLFPIVYLLALNTDAASRIVVMRGVRGGAANEPEERWCHAQASLVSAFPPDFWPQESKQTLSWSQSCCDLHPDAFLLDVLCHLYLHVPSVLQ